MSGVHAEKARMAAGPFVLGRLRRSLLAEIGYPVVLCFVPAIAFAHLP